MNTYEDNRRSGYSLVELVIALTLLTVGLLAFFFTLYANFRAGGRMTDLDRVRVSLDNVAEQLRIAPFPEVFKQYHATNIEVPELEGPDNLPARVQISCYVNELKIPTEFGPVLDIDGKGGLETADCSATYEVLPVRLRLEYLGTDGVVERREQYLILGDL